LNDMQVACRPLDDRRLGSAQRVRRAGQPIITGRGIAPVMLKSLRALGTSLSCSERFDRDSPNAPCCQESLISRGWYGACSGKPLPPCVFKGEA
jgi:hypothetical protein